LRLYQGSTKEGTDKLMLSPYVSGWKTGIMPQDYVLNFDI